MIIKRAESTQKRKVLNTIAQAFFFMLHLFTSVTLFPPLPSFRAYRITMGTSLYTFMYFSAISRKQTHTQTICTTRTSNNWGNEALSQEAAVTPERDIFTRVFALRCFLPTFGGCTLSNKRSETMTGSLRPLMYFRPFSARRDTQHHRGNLHPLRKHKHTWCTHPSWQQRSHTYYIIPGIQKAHLWSTHTYTHTHTRFVDTHTLTHGCNLTRKMPTMCLPLVERSKFAFQTKVSASKQMS